MAEFKKERYGAEVATVKDAADEIVEVMRLADGGFRLIVHNLNERSGYYDDMSVTLKPEQMLAIGRLGEKALCSERECPYFGKERVRSCGCFPKVTP